MRKDKFALFDCQGLDHQKEGILVASIPERLSSTISDLELPKMLWSELGVGVRVAGSSGAEHTFCNSVPTGKVLKYT